MRRPMSARGEDASARSGNGFSLREYGNRLAKPFLSDGQAKAGFMGGKLSDAAGFTATALGFTALGAGIGIGIYYAATSYNEVANTKNEAAVQLVVPMLYQPNQENKVAAGYIPFTQAALDIQAAAKAAKVQLNLQLRPMTTADATLVAQMAPEGKALVADMAMEGPVSSCMNTVVGSNVDMSYPLDAKYRILPKGIQFGANFNGPAVVQTVNSGKVDDDGVPWLGLMAFMEGTQADLAAALSSMQPHVNGGKGAFINLGGLAFPIGAARGACLALPATIPKGLTGRTAAGLAIF